MAPSTAPRDDPEVAPGTAAAVLSCPSSSAPSSSARPSCPTLTTLTQRADFLRAARARYKRMPGLVLQARERREGERGEGIRVGFTCSKKVGNAVARNRAKRRLREVARLVLPGQGRDGWDYVLIGRRDDTDARPFGDLLDDLRAALAALHP